jgi:hypothetical protein
MLWIQVNLQLVIISDKLFMNILLVMIGISALYLSSIFFCKFVDKFKDIDQHNDRKPKS